MEGHIDQYVIFLTLTQAGAQSLDTVGGSLQQVIDELIPDIIVSATLRATFGGPCDLIVDCEARLFEDAAHLALRLAGTGYVQTTTAKAYSLQGYVHVVQHSKMAP
jgi:uncharacterized protein with GYD domain